MKLTNKGLYLIAGALVIVGGKLMILSSIWFPDPSVMTLADKWLAVGQTVFAIGVFALVAALINRVFIDKSKD
jgi:hypothetical protein